MSNGGTLFGFGPYMGNLLGPWLRQLPFNEQKVQFFFAKANEGGTLNSQPFPLLWRRLRGFTYAGDRAHIADMANSLVQYFRAYAAVAPASLGRVKALYR